MHVVMCLYREYYRKVRMHIHSIVEKSRSTHADSIIGSSESIYIDSIRGS
jgi:hypothetical protein